MFTKNLFALSLFLIVFIPAAIGIESGSIVFMEDVDLNKKLLFLDKLSTCTKHKYNASPSGIYKVLGKQNNICKVQWTISDCNFPEGEYQKFANIQTTRTLERAERNSKGIWTEKFDKDYRYLYNAGNKYCTNRYNTLIYYSF